MVRAPQRMTIEEWGKLDEDVPGELVFGQLVDEEEVTFAHNLVAAFLIRILGSWLTPRGGFVIPGDAAKFAVTGDCGRKPDIAAFLPGDPRPPPDASVAHTPPSVMIEIVSPSPNDIRRDRVEKLREYAAFGVRWYWIVDPNVRTLDILELDAHGHYVHLVAATEGEVSVPGCDGLDVREMWAEIDRFGRT